MSLFHLFHRSQARLNNVADYNKEIARGFSVVLIFVLLAKALGAVKEMAIAYYFGVSEELDAFLFVFNLVQWPTAILGSVLTASLVPLASKLRTSSPQDLPTFRDELLGVALWVSLALGLIAFLGLPWLVKQSFLGLTPTQGKVAHSVVQTLVCFLPFAILGCLFAAWTMASKRHLNTLLEACPALAILVLLSTLGSFTALIWGYILGFALQALLLFVPLVLRGESSWARFSWSSPHWRFFLQGFGTLLIAQAILSLVGLVDQFFAVRIGPGELSSLNYANRIMSLFLSLGTVAISRSILPVFSELHSKGKDLFGIACRWATSFFILGLIGAILVNFGAPFLVGLLFQQGEFTARNTAEVSHVLRYATVQAPFYFTSMILVSALLSQQRASKILLITSGTLAVKFLLAILWVPQLGVNGLLLATACVYLTSASLAFMLLYLYHEKN